MLYNSKGNRILNYGILHAFFLISSPLALLRYCVMQKERTKWFELLGLDWFFLFSAVYY